MLLTQTIPLEAAVDLVSRHLVGYEIIGLYHKDLTCELRPVVALSTDDLEREFGNTPQTW